MNKFFEEKDLHYIPIIDAGIKISNRAPYTEGIKKDVFIKSGVFGGPLKAKVWPGKVHFVDFFHPNAIEYWSDMFDILYK